jgi:hypothetical protein
MRFRVNDKKTGFQLGELSPDDFAIGELIGHGDYPDRDILKAFVKVSGSIGRLIGFLVDKGVMDKGEVLHVLGCESQRDSIQIVRNDDTNPSGVA